MLSVRPAPWRFAAGNRVHLDPSIGAAVAEDTGEYDEHDCCTGCGAHIADPHSDDCGQATGNDTGTARKTNAEMSEPEREAARAERRDIIEFNKAGVNAKDSAPRLAPDPPHPQDRI